MPPLIPKFVVPALLITWAIAAGTVDLVRQGRLRGYSIATHAIGGFCMASEVFVGVFVSAGWRHSGKYWIMAGCFALGFLLLALTKKLPVKPVEKKWKKVAPQRNLFPRH